MPLNIPPGFAQVGIRSTMAGDPEPMFMTFGLDISAVGGNAQTVRDAVGAACDLLAPVTNDDITLAGITLSIGQDGGSPINVELPFVTPVQGEEDATCLPQNSAYLIKKFTNTGGRQGRGRLYHPGVAEGVVSNIGILSDARIAALTEAWQSFFEQLATGIEGGVEDPLPPVVLHTLGTAVQDPSIILAAACDPVIATQRRRLRP